MSRYDISAEVVAAIAAAGFKVYQPVNPKYRTWLYYSDGLNLAYMDASNFGSLSISTVNIPCQECGTGFSLRDDDEPFALTAEYLRRGFMTAPNWARPHDRAAVRKWPSVEAWLSAQTLIPMTLVAGA